MVRNLLGYLFGTYAYFGVHQFDGVLHMLAYQGYEQARPQATACQRASAVTLADRMRSNCNDIDPGLVTGQQC